MLQELALDLLSSKSSESDDVRNVARAGIRSTVTGSRQWPLPSSNDINSTLGADKSAVTGSSQSCSRTHSYVFFAVVP